MLVTLSVATTGSLFPFSDAGTGADAGDTPENATVLPEAGNYSGILWPPGDADWYELSPPPTRSACFAAKIGGEATATGILTRNVELNPAVDRPVEPTKVLDLGLSSPGASPVLLGLVPNETPAGPVSVGTYEFELTVVTADQPGPGPGPGDAGTDRDAGGDAPSGIPTEGPCLSGTLDSDTDPRDVYLFSAKEDDRVALSLAQAAIAPARLTLVSPAEGEIAEIRDGEFTDVQLNATGQYQVVAELVGRPAMLEVDYLVGLTINGPEPPPCRPTCLIG